MSGRSYAGSMEGSDEIVVFRRRVFLERAKNVLCETTESSIALIANRRVEAFAESFFSERVQRIPEENSGYGKGGGD